MNASFPPMNAADRLCDRVTGDKVMSSAILLFDY